MIGLIFNVLILLFVVISVLLIYSLLMITTETKTFDYGVMRLVGLSQTGFVSLIFMQAFMFVIPSIICAYIASIVSLHYIWGSFFSDNPPSILPSPSATLLALTIGFLIPLLSAIVPVYRALSKTLTDALNVAKSSTSGVMIKITGTKASTLIPFVLFGMLCVTCGVTIYILLPQSLLTLNLALMLDIFFLILLGMILGLTLISVNLRGFFEFILVYGLLFWERSSMRILLRKNLMAHKRNNWLTSIIYALTLGTIIFLIVTVKLELEVINSYSVIPNIDL